MEVRTVEKPAFNAVGLQYVGKNENGEIPAMWGCFMERVPEITNRTGAPGDFYGLCRMPEGLEPGAFEYIAAVEVADLDAVPEGMVGTAIPAQTYAVFQAEKLSQIPSVYEKAFSEWIPRAGLAPAGGVDFEYYDEAFDPENEGPLWVYIPVRKA